MQAFTAPFAYLYLFLFIAGLAMIYYAGWQQQTTAQQKEIYTMKWLALVKSLAPYILGAIPGVPPVLIPVIVHEIENVEQIPGSTGPQKKAIVLDSAAAALGALKPGTIDVTATLGAVASGIDATVSAINAVHSATK